MNPKQLEAFRLVMRTGSISTAAQQLFVSQPTMSRLLSDLEKSIGLKLFDRRQGKTRVRPEALAFYESVEKVFMGANYLRRVAEEIRNKVGIRLRVGSLPAFGLTLMPGVIAQFYREHPKASIEVTVATSPSLGELVSNGLTDIAVVEGAPQLIGTEILRRFSMPRVAVLRADDPLAGRPVVDLHEAVPHMPIWMAPLANLEPALRQANAASRGDGRRDGPAAGHDAPPVAPPGGSLTVNLADTACRFVSLGLGIAVIDPITALALPVPGLVTRPITPALAFDFCIIVSHRLAMSPVARSFVDRLVAQCEATADAAPIVAG
ncbi:MAG TPA: LysR family transcriptional regulator [Paraburkholderia sp.]|jgi:DNA-binding transcriptional LysR family regulator|nr:LysR family transcriptional regulator [Paraburkholderia sp.]